MSMKVSRTAVNKWTTKYQGYQLIFEEIDKEFAFYIYNPKMELAWNSEWKKKRFACLNDAEDGAVRFVNKEIGVF